MNLLECRDIQCSFGGTVALDAVDLTVDDGESVGIAGHNGAGKTTLINAICGLVPLDAGTVLLSGREASSWPFARRAREGLIRSFEDVGIWQRLSVLDNVAVGAVGRPLAEARRSAKGWLDRLGLSSHETEPAERLSLGERRKVELARILLRRESMNRPALVILDEPTRGLDDAAKNAFSELVQQHLLGHCGLLMVEHDGAVLSRLCSRSITLQSGTAVSMPPAIDSSTESDDHIVTAARRSPGTGPISIRLEDVHVSYGTIRVLRGASLTLTDGEAIQVKGLNGSGKSTLLRTLVGSVKPTSGRIELFGQVVDGSFNRAGAGLGYAPQGGRLIPSLSVDVHVRLARDLALANGRTTGAAEVFCRLFPEVTKLGALPAGDLSSGQRSLVALWTALATEPRILVADEPGAGLAGELRARLYDFLRTEWLSAGRSLLFVEHGAGHPWARPLLIENGVIRSDNL